MSKVKYFLVTLLAVTVCFGVVDAQKTIKPKTAKSPLKKSFNESDLADLQEKAEKQREGIPYRLTMTTEKLVDGKTTPIEFKKTISEELPPDRNRLIVEEKTPNGIKRTEYIDIGRERFIRENNGEWKIFKPTGQGMGRGSGSGFGEEPKIEVAEEKSLTTGDMLKGQKTDRYQTVLRYTYTYPNRVEKLTITKAYWFNQKGMLVKTLDENNDETKKFISRVTETYEYDVKLKIEKPMVK